MQTYDEIVHCAVTAALAGDSELGRRIVVSPPAGFGEATPSMADAYTLAWAAIQLAAELVEVAADQQGIDADVVWQTFLVDVATW